MLWRHAALAVELCERAVEITGRVLPGSYGRKPGEQCYASAGSEEESSGRGPDTDD